MKKPLPLVALNHKVNLAGKGIYSWQRSALPGAPIYYLFPVTGSMLRLTFVLSEVNLPESRTVK